MDLIPGQGARIPHASGPKHQNIKQKQYSNNFNKDFKNGPHQKYLKKNILEAKKKEYPKKNTNKQNSVFPQKTDSSKAVALLFYNQQSFKIKYC